MQERDYTAQTVKVGDRIVGHFIKGNGTVKVGTVTQILPVYQTAGGMTVSPFKINVDGRFFEVQFLGFA